VPEACRVRPFGESKAESQAFLVAQSKLVESRKHMSNTEIELIALADIVKNYLVDPDFASTSRHSVLRSV
jgi:hypothetical protein